MPPDPVNVADHLARLAAAEPDRVALHVPRGDRGHAAVTFAALHAETDALANGLGAAGLTPGSRAAVFVPPSRPFFAVLFALLKLGTVPVLIDPGMGLRGLGRCLAEAEPAAFIGVAKAHAARRLFGWGRRSVTLTVAAGRWRGLCHASAGGLTAAGTAAGPFAGPAAAPADLAAILFTSGSTGPAKGVEYTHGVFAAQVRLLRAVYGITPGEVDLCTFPLFALFGPALGMTCVVPRMDPARPATIDIPKLVADANTFGVTNLFGSPAVLRRWAAWQGDIPTLKRVLSAGAPATAAVIAKVAARLPAGAEVFTPYGATEALPVATIGSREILAETAALTLAGRGVCVGRPVPGVGVCVIRQTHDAVATWDESLALPAGEIGEIVVSGPVVTRAYFRRPDATRLAKIPDPAGGVWHRMGDVGYFDGQGRLWFCGRKSHVVWTPAGPLYPDQVEPVFNAVRPVANGSGRVVRTALVGVTRGGVTHPAVCAEPRKLYPTGSPFTAWDHDAILADLQAAGAVHPHTRGIVTFLVYHKAGGFPVDRRHNAKIGRERLAAWADRRLGPALERRPGMTALVTGGGGFLGLAVVRKLVARGDAVRSLSRTAHPALAALGVPQVLGDLTDPAAVRRAVGGRDVVFHVAAKAGVWGPVREYHAANVVGTRNVIAACRAAGVPRLVFTSTPSVVHGGTGLAGVDESAPYPRHYLAAYPKTKAAAERRVLAANDATLSTVALRPHLVWGPGDPHLVPRVVAAARAGRLRRVGTRPVTVDLTYVENAADAHLAAADRLRPGAPCAGRPYFVTDGAPVDLWAFLNRVLALAGVPPVTRSVPAWQAELAGAACELAWPLLGRAGDPPMTRFVASQLGTDHWYDISAARRDLGYVPAVGLEDGLRRLAAGA